MSTYIDEFIRSRTSVFPPSFSDEMLSDETIRELLETAITAPTHRLTQPWRFKVVRGKALERLGEFLAQYYVTHASQISEIKVKKIKENVSKSQAVILIILHRDPEEKIPKWEEVAALACSVQNLWLSAQSHGVGGYWSSPSSILGMRTFCQLAENESCLGLFYLGYHTMTDPPEKKRKPISELTEWIIE